MTKPLPGSKITLGKDIKGQHVIVPTERGTPYAQGMKFNKYMQQELNELKLTGSLISEKL